MTTTFTSMNARNAIWRNADDYFVCIYECKKCNMAECWWLFCLQGQNKSMSHNSNENWSVMRSSYLAHSLMSKICSCSFFKDHKYTKVCIYDKSQLLYVDSDIVFISNLDKLCHCFSMGHHYQSGRCHASESQLKALLRRKMIELHNLNIKVKIKQYDRFELSQVVTSIW